MSTYPTGSKYEMNGSPLVNNDALTKFKPNDLVKVKDKMDKMYLQTGTIVDGFTPLTNIIVGDEYGTRKIGYTVEFKYLNSKGNRKQDNDLLPYGEEQLEEVSSKGGRRRKSRKSRKGKKARKTRRRH